MKPMRRVEASTRSASSRTRITRQALQEGEGVSLGQVREAHEVGDALRPVGEGEEPRLAGAEPEGVELEGRDPGDGARWSCAGSSACSRGRVDARSIPSRMRSPIAISTGTREAGGLPSWNS